MLLSLRKLHIAAPFYKGVENTLVRSALDGSMGFAFVNMDQRAGCAAIAAGGFLFPAGNVAAPGAAAMLLEAERALWDREFSLHIPPDRYWTRLIQDTFPRSGGGVRTMRFATRKDTRFDRERLRSLVAALPREYRIEPIDATLYRRCMEHPQFRDFCGNFVSVQDYLQRGIGYAVLCKAALVGGASSFSVYRGGIEVCTAVDQPQRRCGVAAAASARLILACLERNLYPSWDAPDMDSLELAQKLGYQPAEAYAAVSIATRNRFIAQ